MPKIWFYILSLFDNAPNKVLVGCIIQKRMYLFATALKRARASGGILWSIPGRVGSTSSRLLPPWFLFFFFFRLLFEPSSNLGLSLILFFFFLRFFFFFLRFFFGESSVDESPPKALFHENENCGRSNLVVFGLWKNTLWVDCGEKPELGILLVKKSVSLLEKKLRYKKNCFGNNYHYNWLY